MSEYIKKSSIIGLAHKMQFGRILTEREVEVVEMVVNSVHDDARVDLVRCRECKYSEHWYGDRNRCFLWVEDGIGVFEDGFCSYGERKGGDRQMSDYIERSAVMQKFADYVKRSNNSDFAPTPTWNEAVQIVEDAPAADVAPVRHGRWETVMLDHERMGCRPTAHYCSDCHQITWFRTFYCPNCGTKMDGGAE